MSLRRVHHQSGIALGPIDLVLTESLEQNVDPKAWLADMLRRIVDYSAKELDDLFPWNWKRKCAALRQAA